MRLAAVPLRARLTIIVALLLLCGGGLVLFALSGTPPAGVADVAATREPLAAYVGSDACARCHAVQAQSWRSSQHAEAMQIAQGDAVKAIADGKPLKHRGGETRYTLRDGKLAVTTAGGDGTVRDFAVSHTFGLYPLQQYLVSLPDGRRQVLGVAWDSRPRSAGGQRWFHLFPDDGSVPGEQRHWTAIDQNWNYQCADCHSTNLRKNFDAATDRFATTWSEISVGCEACHGPGANHVAWASKPAGERAKQADAGLTAHLDERRGVHWTQDGTRPRRSTARSSQREIEVCARCHARRGQFSDDHVAGQPLLDAYRPALLETGLYFVDGQQQDEVFTYGSFLQSRMSAAGVTCSDCHDAHTGRVRTAGNGLCTQCHLASHFDTSSHHHHPDGAGTQCIACHMPPRTYMGVDPRRDHSFRIPRPDRTVALGVPNACAQCHQAKGPRWAAEAIKGWYPTPKDGAQDFAEAFAMAERQQPDALEKLRAIVADAQRPGWVRASALRRLADLRGQDDANASAILNAATEQLESPDDTLRWTAVNALAGMPASQRAYHLAPRLRDLRRLIRIDAARHLAGEAEALLPDSARPDFLAALEELTAAEMFNADRPEAQTRLGDLHAARSQTENAEQAYRKAIAIDPRFAPASINLAHLLEERGGLAAALDVLRQAASANPHSAEIEHALGLALIRQGARRDGLVHLGRAAQRRPESVRIVYVHLVAVHDISGVQPALAPLRAALAKHPQDSSLNALGVIYFTEAGDAAAAARALKRLATVDPERAKQLIGHLRRE